jgi:hypothetical protein
MNEPNLMRWAGYSDLVVLADGETADPAAWGDWMTCVQKVLASKPAIAHSQHFYQQP